MKLKSINAEDYAFGRSPNGFSFEWRRRYASSPVNFADVASRPTRDRAIELNSHPNNSATELLQRYSAGDDGVANELHVLIYDDLRRLAQSMMADEQVGHTLQPTALVNEAFMRLIHQKESGFDGRDHFLRLAARAMRFVLVDHARAKKSAKRSGSQKREALDVALAFYEDRTPNLLEMEDVLAHLETIDPQIVRIVDLRFFGGHTIEETARILDVSHNVVERGWRAARLWLAKELDPSREPQDKRESQ